MKQGTRLLKSLFLVLALFQILNALGFELPEHCPIDVGTDVGKNSASAI